MKTFTAICSSLNPFGRVETYAVEVNLQQDAEIGDAVEAAQDTIGDKDIVIGVCMGAVDYAHIEWDLSDDAFKQ